MAKVLFSNGSLAWANNLNDLRERWHLRREEPVHFVVPVDLFKQDIAGLSRNDLLSFHAELLKLLNAGKKELHKAKSQGRYEGVYLKPDEFSDLVFTVRSIATHIEEVKNAMSKKRRLEQVERDREFEREFVNVAKERLPKDLFLEMIDETKRRLGQIKEGE